MSIDVVIVNWNSGHHLGRCLESLAAMGAERELLQSVTVIDNASSDESLSFAAEVQKALPLRILRNRDNRGFAAACNQGAAGAAGDFLLFLNPDVVLQSGCLSAPAGYLGRAENSRVGIVGIQLLDPNGAIARCCARFPSPGSIIGNVLGLDRIAPSLSPPHFLTEWPHDDTREVDQVMGAFLFIRRCVFERIGRFDERFFVYYEDLDLALRARQGGWRSEYLVDARALHFGGGTTSGIKARRMFYVCRSRLLYCLKHFSFFSALCVMAATLLAEPVIRCFAALGRLRIGQARDTLQAFALLWVDLKTIMSTHYRFGRARSGAEYVE
jgi:hypothetical protein